MFAPVRTNMSLRNLIIGKSVVNGLLWHILCLLLLVLLPASVLADENHDLVLSKINSLLQENVVDGRVRYQALAADPQLLNDIVDRLRNQPEPPRASLDQQKAWWINVYNILVIKGIVDQYPLRSPKETSRFFEAARYTVNGEKLSLNDIEKQKLFARHADPRLHFVLVCAALGCPQLTPEAYRPERLEQMLNQRTTITLNDPAFVRYNAGTGTVAVSELFRWYRDDFRRDGQSLLQYFNQYRKTALPEDAKISFFNYDWTLNDTQDNMMEGAAPVEVNGSVTSSANLQYFTPSTLLGRGQWELKVFNNLYTQTAFFDDNREKQNLSERSSFFANINTFLYGISPRFNIGLDLYFRSVRYDDTGSSAFSLLQFESGPNARSALTQFVPKIKFSPFANLPNFSVQTALVIPLGDDFEGNSSGSERFLDFNNYRWWTQIFYDRPFMESFLFYLESGVFVRFARGDADNTEVVTPFKAIVNYYPSDRWTLYAPLELTPTWDGGSWTAYYTQIGAGAKFQVSDWLELETLYTVFPAGKNSGAGKTFNLGFRVIR